MTVTTYTLAKTGELAAQRNDDELYASFDGAPDFGSMYGGDKAKPDDEYAIATHVRPGPAMDRNPLQIVF